MTTLYRPVLIESAEQAEALSDGTIATSEQLAPEAFVKDGDSWLGTHGPGAFTSTSAVGLTALVPIEAEEEVVVNAADLGLDPERVYAFDNPDLIDALRDAPQRTRLVTPWREA